MRQHDGRELQMIRVRQFGLQLRFADPRTYFAHDEPTPLARVRQEGNVFRERFVVGVLEIDAEEVATVMLHQVEGRRQRRCGHEIQTEAAAAHRVILFFAFFLFFYPPGKRLSQPHFFFDVSYCAFVGYVPSILQEKETAKSKKQIASSTFLRSRFLLLFSGPSAEIR